MISIKSNSLNSNYLNKIISVIIVIASLFFLTSCQNRFIALTELDVYQNLSEDNVYRLKFTSQTTGPAETYEIINSEDILAMVKMCLSLEIREVTPKLREGAILKIYFGTNDEKTIQITFCNGILYIGKQTFECKGNTYSRLSETIFSFEAKKLI